MGRPSRPLLTREGIMRAALELVDEEGAAALSTTRLAARLGVKGPSLYNYVTGRDEIVDGMCDLIVAEMAIDPDVRPWTAALDTWARSYRAAFAAHPNAVPLLAARPTESAAALRGYADAFAMLRAAGWPEDRLLIVVQSIEYFLLGSAIRIEKPRRRPVAPEETPPGLDLILNAAPDFREQAFETGLAVLIRGFEQTLAELSA
ncbi:TetR/AcrR family transcriptional regulator C-terminal domain-containing protein [Streptomyces sp. SP17BM10]|uniref:TetR/AcrR family transcriptional regulator C-terminal domain-containing protein n=1 Tax=Streptomyces sp. SP17BM10 TaxID=3002530 RepID=UPI002E7A0B9B|nr:TetR/AcrR family transcriptional regulator C-terminal domain-containing protein [Streptomyces sp. SP17BM10]MEE1788586.1 TetR/AcrR family transcriptional regulator C-terminal domain-containing protein [Streptomyces sp. SP17BM10]